VGRVLEKKLHNFWQYSELSPGFATSAELLESCILNDNGRVTTAAEVTNLIAESYAAAAQIYLQCRLFKRPRTHEALRDPIARLMKCVAWTPVKGPLFTAQAPLFSVFIGGVAALTIEERAVIRRWFEPIATGRSVCLSPDS
jgi:hypothetical protein